MVDWTVISRNRKKHGHFAGRSEIEQNAYFDFFAGPDKETGSGKRVSLINLLPHLSRLMDQYVLRWMPFLLASMKHTNRQ